jgi:soluble lytic murein transglycosylase-like protein
VHRRFATGFASRIAQRHGWPPGEAWWRTPRLLGHEDITPLSRFDKNGCWDPGGLREKPYFDWPFVYAYLEQLSGGVAPSSPPLAPAPSSAGTVTSLLGSIADRFRHLIQTGQEVLAISEAIRSGQTDLNKLTSLVFFARHPELGGRKLRADERELAQEWLRIRDTLVRPVLARLQAGSSAPAASTAPAAGRTSTKKPSINEDVVARIKQYAPLVEAAAKKHGVEATLINGFIAAESGGNRNLVAKSGYTGLMQSEKKRSHLDPATSIDEGTQKLASFRKIMDGILRKRGHTYDGMPDVDRLQLLALAYNAGPVSVAKALQYAADAGRPEAWREADHYKRALLFTGAYSTSQAAGKCLPNATAAEREARIREAEAIRKKHKFKTEWRKAPDPPAWATVSPTLPAFVQCAIDFKHGNSPRYAAKILAYRDHFWAGG